jgi:hypothetical protein
VTEQRLILLKGLLRGGSHHRDAVEFLLDHRKLSANRLLTLSLMPG